MQGPFRRKCFAQKQSGRGKNVQRSESSFRVLVLNVAFVLYADALLRPARMHLHLFDYQKKREITRDSPSTLARRVSRSLILKGQ